MFDKYSVTTSNTITIYTDYGKGDFYFPLRYGMCYSQPSVYGIFMYPSTQEDLSGALSSDSIFLHASSVSLSDMGHVNS